MEKITGNEPAFPFWEYNQDGYSVSFMSSDINQNILPFNRGLTIRQYFAALAMQALCTHDSLTHVQVSRYAIEQADDLIQKLNSIPNPNENP